MLQYDFYAGNDRHGADFGGRYPCPDGPRVDDGYDLYFDCRLYLPDRRVDEIRSQVPLNRFVIAFATL